ncbi:zinc finger protein 782-like [Gigantopelta aegis]|uniref:zinc finger protein 782-like n=1 Tax=Gigantopelta aegis TaxID=1735272 RepID=UPI001B889CE8|nr:zinc finger protein 782-like [Gigantopelta aegis]XP_041348311.1 zinc finger protein 782-like [Gigantopelta aegis]
MTLSDLVFGKDFTFGHCFHSIPSPTSRMIPYSDIFVDFRGFPSSVASSHSSTHPGSEVSPSCTDSSQTRVHSPSLHSSIACPCPNGLREPRQPQHQTPGEDLGSEEQRSFKCPQCRYVTDRKNNLKRHIVTMHQECTKTLECCGIVFQSKSLLRDHVGLFHRGGYRCQICSRNFCRKALLRRHLTVHSGRKDFRCDLCGYATSHKSNLERHQKVHSRKPANQVGSDLQPFIGLSFNYSNIILEPAQTMLTSQNSRLLPRYRLLPDRLKQTHTNSTIEIHRKTKWKNRVSRSFKNHSSMLNNTNNQCHQLDDDSGDGGNIGSTCVDSEPTESKRGASHQTPSSGVESLTTGPKTSYKDKIPTLSSNNDQESICTSQIYPDFAPEWQPLEDRPTVQPNESEVILRGRTRTAKRRIFAAPYKCPICKEIFSFQIDLSSHQCTHTTEENLSVITAIRKGKLKLSPI